MAIEAGPDGSTKRIFVQLSDFNGFVAVDFNTRSEVARVELPHPTGSFDTDPGRTTAPSHGIGVDPDSNTLWVTSIPNNAVFVYALKDLALVGQVSLPDLRSPGRAPIAAVPNWVTFANKTAYISNAALRSLTAIDTASMRVITTISVGEVPKRINSLTLP
jgi:YVTN family beta-propeller protein